MSFWRKDLLEVNGYDERMIGYGSEDLELDQRLRQSGLRRSQIKFAALALHLEHQSSAPPDPSAPELPNNQLLYASRDAQRVRCEQGLDHHMPEFSVNPATDMRVAK